LVRALHWGKKKKKKGGGGDKPVNTFVPLEKKKGRGTRKETVAYAASRCLLEERGKKGGKEKVPELAFKEQCSLVQKEERGGKQRSGMKQSVSGVKKRKEGEFDRHQFHSACFGTWKKKKKKGGQGGRRDFLDEHL